MCLVSWNLPNGAKHWGSIFKNMGSSEGDQLLAGALHATVDETSWYTSNCKEVKLEMNFHKSRILFQKYTSYKCQFFTKVRAPWRLVFEILKIFQPKYWNVMLRQLKLTTKKRLVFEQFRQTSQRIMNYVKSNFKALKFQWRKHFRLWVFRLQFWMLLLLALLAKV